MLIGARTVEKLWAVVAITSGNVPDRHAEHTHTVGTGVSTPPKPFRDGRMRTVLSRGVDRLQKVCGSGCRGLPPGRGGGKFRRTTPLLPPDRWCCSIYEPKS